MRRAALSLDAIIGYLEGTPEDGWLTGRCRSTDGEKNCLLGHIFDFGGGDEGNGSAACDLFEEIYATTYMFFGVNDGEHPDYPQPTPKQRILAYLRNMRDGREPTTLDHLRAQDEEFDRSNLSASERNDGEENSPGSGSDKAVPSPPPSTKEKGS